MANKCDVCNKIFSTKGSLVKHKRTHYKKPYKCDVCDKRFARGGQLTFHKRTHTGEKPYECDVCKKRFSASSNFARHERTHIVDKPYECEVCKKKFAQQSNLATHKKTHTRRKVYECLICKKRFSASHKLSQHKISARKKKKCCECGICKKTFTRRQNLKLHWRLHLRDDLLLCYTCGKEIAEGERHAKESDDDFVCDKCNNQFPDINGLYKHKAKDHNIFYQCELCKELEAKKPNGIAYICFVCDAEYGIANELEERISMHGNGCLTS